MLDPVTAHLKEALEELRAMVPTREISLTITKIEEALLWWAASIHVGDKRVDEK